MGISVSDASPSVQRALADIEARLRTLERKGTSESLDRRLDSEVTRLSRSISEVAKRPTTLDRRDVFKKSGTAHDIGYVPDPGASAATTHFLREDGTWVDVLQLTGGALSGDVLMYQTGSAKPTLTITNANADALGGALFLRKGGGSPAAGDENGKVIFDGVDSNGNYQAYSKIVGITKTVAAGSEEGEIILYVYSGATPVASITIDPVKALFGTYIDSPVVAGVVYNNADITGIVINTDTLVTFNTELFDPYLLHDTGSNTSRLTAPTGMAGVWLWHARVAWEGLTTPVGYRSMWICKNTAGTYSAAARLGGIQEEAVKDTTQLMIQDAFGFASLNAADYLELFVRHSDTGGNLKLKNVNTIAPQFSMWRVGT